MSNEVLSETGETTSIRSKFEQVRKLVAGMVPVKRACESVGLNRSTYYLLLNAQEEAPASEQARGDLSTPRDTKRKSSDCASLARGRSGSATPLN